MKYGLGRAWGFSVLTSGLWPAYWLHRNRRLFDGELGRGRDDAAFHTVGPVRPEPDPGARLRGSAPCSRHWDVRTAGLATEAPRNTAETVLLAIGAVGWLLSILWLVLLILTFFEVGPLADMV